jgi:tRNA pseudouridine55 synthase
MSLILIDKPAGPTSHAVVSAIKRSLRADKVGHLGTLDPFASGLLPVMVGNTSRLSDEAMQGRKGYLFTIRFGQETDTLDPTGRVVAEANLPSENSLAQLTQVLNQFTGPIEQVPPVYSALKMNGRPLYEHIRATGVLPADIETKRRIVQVDTLEIINAGIHELTLRTVVSKGTYIRSLARDIARALGSVGTCVQLRRECVEPWHVNHALKLSLDGSGRVVAPSKEELLSYCHPPWSVAPELARAIIPESLSPRLESGNALSVHDTELIWETDRPHVAHTENPLSEKTMTVTEKNQRQGLSPLKIFLKNSNSLFLCEAICLDGEEWKIQPRKRIQ